MSLIDRQVLGVAVDGCRRRVDDAAAPEPAGQLQDMQAAQNVDPRINLRLFQRDCDPHLGGGMDDLIRFKIGKYRLQLR